MKNIVYLSGFYLLRWLKYLCFGFAVLVLPVSGFAQIFQNNNTSCQDISVVGQNEPAPFDTQNPYVSHSISCGYFNADEFLDCATQRHPLPIPNANDPVPSNSILFNSGNASAACPNENANEAGLFSEPADLLSNLGFSPQEPNLISPMGTIASGNLDNQAFDDLVWVRQGPLVAFIEDSGLQFLLGEVGGGFAPDFNPKDVLFGNIPGNIFGFPSYFVSGLKRFAEPSLLLLNCDADPVDEAVVAVQTSSSKVGILLAQNNGNGLIDPELGQLSPLPVTIDETSDVSLSSGDFNGDGLTDIIAAVNTAGQSNDALVFCQGNGACGFTCPQDINDPQVFNLSLACGQQCQTSPTSLSAGDFNGDGLTDIAVAESRISQIRYLFNNNGNGANGKIANWQTSILDLSAPGVQVLPLVLRKGRFSPNALQNNVDELAYTYNVFNPDVVNGVEENSGLRVVLSQGKGINPVPLTLNFTPANPKAASSLFTGNLDRCGFDDIIALAQTNNNNQVQRFASVFLSKNEAPSLQIGPDLSAEINTPLSLAATCSDSTRDDRTFSWTVLSGPVGAQASFSLQAGELQGDSTDASTQFQANIAGDYTIQLTCSDACDPNAATLNVKLIDNGSGAGSAAGTGTGTTTGGETALAQGACVANLNGQDSLANFSLPLCLLIAVLSFIIRRLWNLAAERAA